VAIELRESLDLTYRKLEALNLEAKQQRFNRAPAAAIRAERLRYLTGEPGITTVTVFVLAPFEKGLEGRNGSDHKSHAAERFLPDLHLRRNRGLPHSISDLRRNRGLPHRVSALRAPRRLYQMLATARQLREGGNTF
jgi:hypothetical protein